jgi:crotonobetaine/carnitine-CoA ligase
MTDSVRCKGENVSAWEVEHVAAEHEDIEDCAMIGVAVEMSASRTSSSSYKPKSRRAPKARRSRTLRLAEKRASLHYQNAALHRLCRRRSSARPSQRIMKHRLSPRLDDAWDRAAAAAVG